MRQAPRLLRLLATRKAAQRRATSASVTRNLMRRGLADTLAPRYDSSDARLPRANASARSRCILVRSAQLYLAAEIVRRVMRPACTFAS